MMQYPTTSPAIKPAKKRTSGSLFEDTIGQVSMPQRGRAADYRDEVSPPHSITSSARASTDGGTVRPSALAVLRLITSLVLGRRLHRQVGRLLAFEDAVDVAGRSPELVDPIGPIGDQAASGDEASVRGRLRAVCAGPPA